MRPSHVRALVGTIALVTAIAYFRHATAADGAGDDFKALVAEDAALAQQAVEAVGNAKGNKGTEKNATTTLKAIALYVSAYSNTSSDPKAGAARSAALQLYKAAAAKNMKDAEAAAKALKGLDGADAPKVDLAKEFKDASPKEVMHLFFKTKSLGLGTEDDIKAYATKKKQAKGDTTAAIASRILAMGELNKAFMTPEKDNEKDVKEWNEFNVAMIAAAEELRAAGRANKPAADLAKVFGKVDGSCVACHDRFK